MKENDYPSKINYLLYTINNLNESFKDKTIGKTIIQKIIYLANRQVDLGFNYTLYHYGPFSSEVVNFLDYCEIIGLIEVGWSEDKGYDITAKEKIEIGQDIKNAIDEIVMNYGNYNTSELSIISTAYYLQDMHKIRPKNLVKKINEIKPKFTTQYIEKTLSNANIIS